MKTTRIISVGLAIFTMLFGAGNVIFPLNLGREMGSQVFFAILGLTLTGVLVPLLGLVSSSLFDGDYKKFFGMSGHAFGTFCALTCMLVVGPFGATPRCITLAYASVHWHLPTLSLFVFSIIAACLVFVAAYKKNKVVDLFGRFLGPIKCGLLFTIVILGLLSTSTPPVSPMTSLDSFLKGFNEGYLTLDLIATIFFAGLIISGIKLHKRSDEELSSKEIVVIGLKAGLIGGTLLSLVYTGFCVLSAKYSLAVANVGTDQLLSALATLVLGSHASILANATMAIACLTTAIALTAVFADYLTHELFFGKIKYSYALLLTVTMTFIMTNLGFAAIARIIEPVAMILYPALIALSLANIAYVLWGFRFTKPLVLFTFLMTLVVKFAPLLCR